MHKASLREITVTKERGVDASFTVEHTAHKTKLEQTLRIQKSQGGWVASMEMEGMEAQGTPDDAAQKLADWMQRMAEAIRAGTFNGFELQRL